MKLCHTVFLCGIWHVHHSVSVPFRLTQVVSIALNFEVSISFNTNYTVTSQINLACHLRHMAHLDSIGTGELFPMAWNALSSVHTMMTCLVFHKLSFYRTKPHLSVCLVYKFCFLSNSDNFASTIWKQWDIVLFQLLERTCWGQVRRLVRRDHPAARKGTSSVIMLTAWWLWKRRNTVIFDTTWPDLGGLLDIIKVEAKSWAAAGASGVAALLPSA
jgi:hypothetical protein